MYTQCPDCGTSFRVTAVVLKQAAGKVRCGGCGNAFNALAHLSEIKPDPSTRTEADGSLPELTPDPSDADSHSRPTVISPEQSAALLKTLDQLAGEDIRLEDTGIEWRVLGADEEETPTIDSLLRKKPTEVDEFLTKTPTEVEAAEIFEDPVPSVVDAAEVFDADDAETSAEELRFDDNTGLPDDFDFDSIPSTPAGPAPEPMPEPENVQVDLALGDPDEWGELLDEVGLEQLDDPDDAEAEPDPEPEPSGEEDELAAVSEGGSEDAPLDIDTQFGMQAEAMGIDLSGIHERSDEEEDEDEPHEEPDFPDSTGALEFELSKAQKAAAADLEEEQEAEEETSIDDDLIAAAFENEKAAAESAESLDEEKDLDEAEEEEEEPGDVIDEDFEETLTRSLDEDLDDELDGKFDENVEKIEIKLEDEEDVSPGHYVPPPTEEEQTINMMIDEELFSMAVEDEDGFASTIAIENKKVGGKGQQKEDKKPKDIPAPAEEEGSGFETIIMEGEFVRSAAEQEKHSEAARNGVGDPGFVLAKEEPQDIDPRSAPSLGMIAGAVVLALLLVGQFVHQSRTALATVPAINDAIAPVYRAVGAPITPDWDVTGWRFEITKGSTNPIGEFIDGDTEEAVVDEVDDSADIVADEDQTLTIYSRIGNQSDGPLPYPLISVALTDRFEEIIGSKVLEPSEYLTGNFDPRLPVPSGNTFNAVISVDSPAPQATGFKLSVCYRQDSGLLRCAIEDFR